MKNIIFPGSFDPLTKAHLDIIKRLKKLNYNVYIVVLNHNSKKYRFSTSDRIKIIELNIEALDYKDIKIIQSDSLLVEVCQKYDIRLISRGLRNSIDYEYEKIMEFNNKQLKQDIEYIYLNTEQKYEHISSSIVRELLKYNQDIEHLVGITTNQYILTLQK